MRSIHELHLFSSTERPQIMDISFESNDFLEGDLAQTNCVLRKGDSPLVISWIFNGQPLVNSEGVQILKVGRTSILTIDPVRGENQGNYTCTASNPAGQMSVHTSLIVHGTSWA